MIMTGPQWRLEANSLETTTESTLQMWNCKNFGRPSKLEVGTLTNQRESTYNTFYRIREGIW